MLCRSRFILSPLLKIQPLPSTAIRHARSSKPYIKIRKDKFQVTLNLRHYKKEEISVKADPDYVVIEGKQERNTKDGHIERRFVRKFTLPDGCRIKEMTSHMSPEGVLTVTAPRSYTSPDVSSSLIIPIDSGKASEGKDSKEQPASAPDKPKWMS
ncbi:heat shock protein 26-like [Anticarsia gemmatalis]|uniref:heat shock protein 26-like n=1 Tax=Anticarsia gemmatalis TaxID=129554 RepID=UPI003F775470